VNILWRIELLGDLRAVSEDRVITRFRNYKAGALLAYLAFHLDRRHPREVLFELFWPECVPNAGRHNLSVALSSLRHQLEPPGVPQGAVIIADRASVRLNPAAVTTDVAEFEAALQSAQQTDSQPEQTHHLLTAVELYRGALLPDYYENWILLEGQRLSELFFQSLRQLMELLEETGDFNRALQYTQRGVSVDPLREESHTELMRLYAAAGQPTSALRQYAELERILREEFNDTPTPATRELAHAINHQLPVGKRQLAISRRKKTESRRQPAEDHQLPSVNRQPSTVNLPLQLTRFFGREAEMAWLQETLLSSDTRLVTLTGAGGSGKTRLACEVAGRLVEPLRGAVYFAALADISDPRLIVDRVLAALRLPRSPDVEPMEQVVETLSRQPSLLVLDNMEHLLENGKWKMENGEQQGQTSSSILHSPFSILCTLLERVPTLTLLVTSRQRLNLSGEREFLVPPLPVPSGETDSPEWLMQCESVQLFVDRAQAVKPDFQVTENNAATVAELCYKLEGIPLALELAASRSLVMTPARILAQLENRFDFLVSRQRDVAERHRTLRAAMEWSYRLLTPELQTFFAQLSVFRGGWTLEAAEEVCMDVWEYGRMDVWTKQRPHVHTPTLPYDVLDLLAQLRECSLILTEESGGEMRFRMLETLREFGWEQLNTAERAALQRRHAEYYAALAEQARPGRIVPEQLTWWLDRLGTEHDNLRAALEWSLSQSAECGVRSAESESSQSEIRNPKSEIGLRIAGSVWWFWYRRGYLSEGRGWLEALLKVGGEVAAAVRAEALRTAGYVAVRQGDHEAARRFAEENLAARREMGDKRGIALALELLGGVADVQGDYEAAQARYEESLALWRELGDKGNIAPSLHALGHVAHRWGDYEAARTLLEESLALWRELGDKWSIARVLDHLGVVAVKQGNGELARRFGEEALSISRDSGNKEATGQALNDLGHIAYYQEDWADARAFYEESLKMWRDIGRKPNIVKSLWGLALVARGQEQWERAARLFGAEEALREVFGQPFPPVERPEFDCLVAPMRAALGEEAFAAAWAKGRAMTLEQAVAYALEGKT
jgi:predicted ATPase/DNA-binding SARP family transcriptional activator